MSSPWRIGVYLPREPLFYLKQSSKDDVSAGKIAERSSCRYPLRI